MSWASRHSTQFIPACVSTLEAISPSLDVEASTSRRLSSAGPVDMTGMTSGVIQLFSLEFRHTGQNALEILQHRPNAHSISGNGKFAYGAFMLARTFLEH